jgi:hypothetical protein
MCVVMQQSVLLGDSELCADAIAVGFAEISGVSLPLTGDHGSTTRNRSQPRTVDVGAGTALS